jgi:reverse transcriptase-like protein/integrase-like protein/Pol polyprotein/LTR polyprotein gag-polypeptide-like protein
MAEETTNERKITLREFKAQSYKVWEMATKAHLQVHGLFGILDGTDPDPRPRDDDGRILAPLGPTISTQYEKWKHNEERTRDAIIRCLPDAELLKLEDVQHDVAAMWKRLHDEYGRSSNLEYVRASNELTTLKKDDKTTINDHIDKFEKLVHEVNYNKPSGTTKMEDAVVNLKFLNTLMVDKSTSEKWETFINAKGPQLESMTTQQLYAEVRVNAGRAKPVEAIPNEVKALRTEFQQSFAALNTRIDSFQRNSNGNGGHGRNRGRGRGGNRGGTRGHDGNNGGSNGSFNGRGRGGRRGNNRRSKFPYDTNKSCEIHGRGHSTDECIVLKRRARDRESQSLSGNQHNRLNGRYGDYRPNFNRQNQPNFNGHFTADVTRMSVRSTQVRHTSDPYAWIIDTAANAFITPFKNRLQNYRDFNEGVQVAGFNGKPEIAKGFGSITLTDRNNSTITLNDVVYVPECPDQIISLMKLRREYRATFDFTGVETFKISLPNGAFFLGESVNDILHIWELPTLRTSAVMTRSVHRKRQIEEVDGDTLQDDGPNQNNDQPIGSLHSPRARSAPPSPIPPKPSRNRQKVNPLYCTPKDLWHLRFGHASTTTLRNHPYIKSNHDSTHCVVCIRAKHVRQPFHPSNSKVTRKLERIHSDVCGPFPSSKGSSIYILTFLDELTHWCWVVPVSDRSSTTICEEYLNLIRQIETETELKIKYLRTDGGKEYQGDLTPVLKQHGIKHEPTSPHSPQSNGRAERLNRTLENFTRAMLYQANMPESFWAEAVTTAAYLINRLPSESINGEIPYELWHQKRLPIDDLKGLRPFGCIVHIDVPKQRQKRNSKLKTRATTGCFVGYTGTNTMHRVWDFERKVFVNSHDVTFFETQFPKPTDFNEPPADPYDRSSPSPSSESSPEPKDQTPSQAFEEIIVQSPPALRVFKTYGNFQPENDPPSFADAMRRPDAKLWWEAFCDEIRAIIARKVWTLVQLPPGKRALPLRWVCRTKRDALNRLERYKGRVVVKGFAQEAGLDFDETFAPVVRMDSVRTLFAISAANDLYIIQVDCKNAFLHSNSDFEIYVQQPEGFVDPNHPNAVLLLNKALYGLKQAPRLWYLLLSEVIVGIGFRPLETDPNIYVRGDTILVVYVDDMLIAGTQIASCNAVASELARKIEIVNKGEVKTFLGLNVTRNYPQHSISISQPGYIDRLLIRFNMTNARPASTPFESGTKLRFATTNDALCDIKLYQELTGSLNHLAVYSRPDIAFAVSKLSKFNSNPTTTHFKAALHVLRYLKSTRNYCIRYQQSSTVSITDIIGYSDADHASDEDDRKSYTGYVFIIYGGAVSWSTHKQHTVAFSSMESEYMALSDASREALARKQLFEELQIPAGSRPVPILTDSQTAMEISDNPAKYRQAKHIDVRYHAVRHYIHDGKIEVDYVPSAHQPADIFTKALDVTKHQRFTRLIGLCNSYEA